MHTMNDLNSLTKAQKDDLLIEWNLYSKSQKAPILKEFHTKFKNNYSQKDFLEFLRQKLEIDGYWLKMGIH